MVVDINTDFLINNKITADQYLILNLVLVGKANVLRDYCLVNSISTDKLTADIKNLADKGLIEGYVAGLYDFNNLKPSSYTKNLFNADDFFKEFLGAYPLKVTRSDGTVDYLRTDQSKARMLYMATVVNKKAIHDHLMKCLKHEIKFREANGSMKYMKRMTSWLTSAEWESYEDQIDDLGQIEGNVNDAGYGTELL